MSSLSKRASRRLDASGHFCPAPILMTEEEIAGMKAGEILEVIFTDPGAKPDLEAWCKMAKHEILAIKWEKTAGNALIQK